MKNSNTFEQYKGNSFYLVSAIITLCLFFLITSLGFFCPDFIKIFNTSHGSLSYYSYLLKFYNFSPLSKKVGLIIYLVIFCTTILCALIPVWLGIRYVLVFLNYPKWIWNYSNNQAKIINSCDPSKFNDRVAMVVTTCNDLSPNTLLQTAKQTYKKMDVWISDDSSKPEMIEKIDKFAAEHGFHVIRRNIEHKKSHPTKIGNMMYFLEKFGDNYDFVFENDSSSIVTPNFVQNCLCYFHSPLIDNDKVGGIVCNGYFYGAKNLISYILSKQMQLSETCINSGGVTQANGHPVSLIGWGSFYSVKCLRSLPLEKIECPVDDSARGMWLTANGYKNYLDPFDFAAKMGPQNVEAKKNQVLKWNGGDVFCLRAGHFSNKYPNLTSTVPVKSYGLLTCIFIPLTFSLGLLNIITCCCINFVYFNFTLIILSIPVVLVVFVLFLFVVKHNGIPLNYIFIFIVSAAIGMSMLYKRAYQIVVRGYIQHKWSTAAVTVKTIKKSTFIEKIKMCKLDFLILVSSLTLCLCLTFCLSDSQLSPLLIWFSLFIFTALPSIMYIICVLFGEIPVKFGWDDSCLTYPVEQFDFRFNFVKQNEIWKQQNSKNVK